MRPRKQVKAALAADGYPAKADPGADELAVIFLLCCWSSSVAATALYGPQAAALVEMFPTRVRYTAMSLPYHVGTGWVGGFLPVTSFALVAITGDIYASLWYPVDLHRDLGRGRADLPQGNARKAAGEV